MPQNAPPPPPAGYTVTPPPPAGYTVAAPPIDLRLPQAIGQAEGARPEDHNPGNLSLDAANKLGFKTSGSRRSQGIGATDIAQFPDDETGQRALLSHLSKYPPTTSYQDLANQYAPGQPDWLNNVTKIMGAKPTDPIGGSQYLPKPKPKGGVAPGAGQHDSPLWAQTKETANRAADTTIGAVQSFMAPYEQAAGAAAQSVNTGLKGLWGGFSPEELQKGGELSRFMSSSGEPVGAVGEYGGAIARRIGGGIGSLVTGMSAGVTIPAAGIAPQLGQIMRPAEDLPAGLTGGFKVGPDGRYTVGNEDVDKALQTLGGTLPFALLGGMYEDAATDPSKIVRDPKTNKVIARNYSVPDQMTTPSVGYKPSYSAMADATQSMKGTDPAKLESRFNAQVDAKLMKGEPLTAAEQKGVQLLAEERKNTPAVSQPSVIDKTPRLDMNDPADRLSFQANQAVLQGNSELAASLRDQRDTLLQQQGGTGKISIILTDRSGTPSQVTKTSGEIATQSNLPTQDQLTDAIDKRNGGVDRVGAAQRAEQLLAAAKNEPLPGQPEAAWNGIERRVAPDQIDAYMNPERRMFRGTPKPPVPEGYTETAPPTPKITTDSLGVKWAENEAGVKVSIPNRVPDEEINNYANSKLAEQATAQAAIKEKVSVKPEEIMPKSAPLKQQLADLERSSAKLRRPDLLPNQRSYLAENHDAALTEAAKTLADHPRADEALNVFADQSSKIGKKIDYLERHLKDRDKILETERAAADVTRTGQDVTRNKAVSGVPLHPERDPYGNMLVDEAGQPTMQPGAPRAMRDALGNLLGKRQVEVPDKMATPEGPVPEHIQRAMDERDELKEAISSGGIGPENFGDASDSLKTLESIISEYRRTATKLAGRPTKEQVAAQRGVPVSEVATTGAGKAVDINHNGLPVITRTIWENEYGGGKGRPLPSTEQIQRKVVDLKAQKEIVDTVSSRAAEQRAIAAKKPTQGGFIGEGSQQDETRKLLGNIDSQYYRSLNPETPAPYQGWLAPDRTHFVPTGGMVDIAQTHEVAARLLLGEEHQSGVINWNAQQQLMDRGWIRKQNEGEYEVRSLTPRKVSAIEADAIAGHGSNYPVIVDYINKNGEYKSLTSNEDWLERGLLKDYNNQLSKYGEPRITGEEGVSGVRIAGGMTIGGGLGYAVGGPVGAGIGMAVGGIASAIDFKTSIANLSTELGELRSKFGYSVDQARDSYKNWLAPVSKDPAVSDVMFNRNAEIARSDAHARNAFSAYRLGGYSLPRDMQVKFVDLVKAGDHAGIQAAFGPEWRQYSEDRLIKEEDNYKRMQAAVDELSAAKGGGPANMLPYIENHDRVMWRTLPGGKDWAAHNLSRQLEGTKGMLKQHTLADMSTGVKAGGVPYSWNPVENDLLAWHDTERFIQTTRAVAQFIDQHKNDSNIPGAEFVKLGEKAPNGYVKVAGTKSEVYFPAQSGEGLVKAGEWYMHKDIARMVDNVSSPDYIRGNVLGRTWLGWRRAIGTGRLFGPFHAFLMNTTAIGYKAGMGIREVANLGIGNADIGHIMSGLRDLATSPVSGISEFKIGQAAREGEFDPSFWQRPEGAKLKQLYPGIENYMDLLWQGGGKNMFRVDEDMRLRYSEGIKQHAVEAADKFSKGKYIQSGYEASATAGNALLLPIQLAMKPLFETYIPSLKLGHALKDLDLSLQERAADITSGKTTEATVARDVVRRVEGYFGEFNTDNLFLKNTFRTALTAYYRSFSFRFGTVDRAWAAVKGQATNVAEAAKGNARLQLNPDVAVWGGLMLHAAIGSAILMKTMAHKNPSSLTDVMHPQMGELDDRGKPIRADWPSYVSGPLSQIKQNYGLGTVQYATGGQSDFLQFMKEAINNRKFDGGYVADPAEHDKMGQLFYRMSHAVVPIAPGKYPFVIENTQRWATSGMSRGKATAAVALGMSPTRRAEGLSDAEGLALELGSASSHSPIYSEADKKRYQATRELTAGLRNQRADVGQRAGELLRSGEIQPNDLARAMTNSRIPYLQYEVQGDKYKRGLDFKDTYTVMKAATPAEKNLLVPYFIKLYATEVAKDPKNQASTTSRFLEVMPHGAMPDVGQPREKVKTEFHANLPIGETMGDPDTRFSIAQHEASHAVVAESAQPGSVQNVSLHSRGGVTNVAAPHGAQYNDQLSHDDMVTQMAVSLAGGLGETGGTNALHAAADNLNRHALIGGLASEPNQNWQRMLMGGVKGHDPMLEAPELQAEGQARANIALSDPRMRAALQGIAGQLNQVGQLSGAQVRGYLKNGR